MDKSREKLRKAFFRAKMNDFWNSLSDEEKSYLDQHVLQASKRGLAISAGTSGDEEYFLPTNQTDFLADFVEKHSIYYLKSHPDLRSKFEHQLYSLGGDYFVCGSKIKDLIYEGKITEATSLFYGLFIANLFPTFISNQLEQFDRFGISSSEGWDSFIDYLIISGNYREAEALIDQLSNQFSNHSFQSWIQRPLKRIKAMERKVGDLINRLRQGEEIIQSQYYKQEPDDGYWVIKSAIQQELIEKQKFKRSFRIVMLNK